MIHLFSTLTGIHHYTSTFEDDDIHSFYHELEGISISINDPLIDPYPEEKLRKKIISYNYTEKIFGKRYKYMITDDGLWHLDPCSVIGNNKDGLVGRFKKNLERSRRRLNPYMGELNGEWPNGIVPLDITTSYTDFNRNLFTALMVEYRDKTSIKIVERTNETTYIEVIKGSGCWSYIGVTGSGGMQQLSIGSGCDSLATFVHEVGHALGMHHTQQRKDRDNYVTIDYTNIQSGKEGNFALKNTTDTCGCYDCSSVMHYSTKAFAIDSSKNTITSKSPTCQIGRNYSSPLTINDANCIQNMYFGTADACHSLSPTLPTAPTLIPTPNPTRIPTTARPTPDTDNFCLYTLDSSFDRNVQGYYTQAGTSTNGYPYYTNEKIAGSTLRYIYYGSGYWNIANCDGCTSKAQCTTAGDTIKPKQCQWTNSYSALKTIQGPCYRAQCKQIKVTTNDAVSGGCLGIFDYVSDNHYYNGARYWSYNDRYNFWLCETSGTWITNSGQGYSWYFRGEITEYPLMNDGYTYYFAQAGDTGTEIYMLCSSESPTHTGETRFPTKIPSKTPSIIPTSNPTLQPTTTPITSTPTLTPTTKYPTITPTKTPTKYPSVTPTQKPTSTPITHSPTNYPTLITLEPSDIPTSLTINPTLAPTIEPRTTGLIEKNVGNKPFIDENGNFTLTKWGFMEITIAVSFGIILILIIIGIVKCRKKCKENEKITTNLQFGSTFSKRDVISKKKSELMFDQHLTATNIQMGENTPQQTPSRVPQVPDDHTSPINGPPPLPAVTNEDDFDTEQFGDLI